MNIILIISFLIYIIYLNYKYEKIKINNKLAKWTIEVQEIHINDLQWELYEKGVYSFKDEGYDYFNEVICKNTLYIGKNIKGYNKTIAELHINLSEKGNILYRLTSKFIKL